MTKEQRAEQLMAKGPIWLVRRVMELERALLIPQEDLDRAHDYVRERGWVEEK